MIFHILLVTCCFNLQASVRRQSLFCLQLFLKANIGMDYVDFYNLLHVIASWRLHELPQQFSSLHEPHLTPDFLAQSSADDDDAKGFDSTDHHLVYDLFRLEKVLEWMTEPGVLDVLDVGSEQLLSSPTSLHAQVLSTVTEICKALNICCSA